MTKEVSELDTSLVTANTPLGSCPVGSLFLTHGPLAGREVPLTRETFFIGRGRNNNLELLDKSVSRKHAVINLLGGEYTISDLNSLKGIYVNGKKVEEAVLRPGDVINIGESRMQFRMLEAGGGTSGRKWSPWSILMVLLMGILIGGATWFIMRTQRPELLPKDVMNNIEAHYVRGVEMVNKEHDLAGARVEWGEVLRLDPQMKTDFAAKAAKLLKDTE